MKHLAFITIICSTMLHSMDNHTHKRNPAMLAKTIAAYMLATAKKTTPEQTILYVKDFLDDVNLASHMTCLVKKDLIDILAQKICKIISVRVDPAQQDMDELRRTLFIDGTYSLTAIKNFFPLDRSYEEVIVSKQISPWHTLSFEDFVRNYYASSKNPQFYTENVVQ